MTLFFEEQHQKIAAFGNSYRAYTFAILECNQLPQGFVATLQGLRFLAFKHLRLKDTQRHVIRLHILA
ncbi:hypothetical protein C1893_01345 [Pseudomonas sp. MPR-ANC1]|nr:hypothetical protein C1893_01345 [Pseudomonas sp. MPR-ANC1]